MQEQLHAGDAAQTYDFDARIRQIAEDQEREREARKLAKKMDKDRKRLEKQEAASMDVDQEAMVAMGFGGFGSTKNKR